MSSFGRKDGYINVHIGACACDLLSIRSLRMIGFFRVWLSKSVHARSPPLPRPSRANSNQSLLLASLLFAIITSVRAQCQGHLGAFRTSTLEP